MKYIAIDYGIKRVGLAVSDKDGTIAFAREAILRTTRLDFFSKMLNFIEDEEANAIVVGMPYSLDGAETLITRQVYNFLASLRRRTNLPIYIVDERLSSYMAEEDLRACGLKASEIKKHIDAQAAAHILNSFLCLDDNNKVKYE